MSDNQEQSLEILDGDIPDSFDSLIREVTSSYGLPLSYIRVHQANLLEMVIPPRSKRELSHILDNIDITKTQGFTESENKEGKKTLQALDFHSIYF